MKKLAGRKPNSDATPARMADLITFEVAVLSYKRFLEQNGEEPDQHLQRAKKILRRYRDPITNGLQEHVASFAETPSGGPLKPYVRKAMRAGSFIRLTEERCALYLRFLRWASSHQSNVRGVYKNRALKLVRVLMRCSDEENPKVIINLLAAQPSVSGLTMTRRWIKKAARLIGVEPDEVERAVADNESAKAIAEDIKKVKQKIQATDPMTEEAAELEMEKQELSDQLEEMIEDSESPDDAKSNAVDVISDDDLPQWLKEMNLDPEKEKVVLAEGKVLVNAGAGSGKTYSMVAKIGYAVKEQGYSPDEILATSFTRAASAEIKERVKDELNIESKNIGRTTHSICMGVIMRHKSELREAFDNFSPARMNALIKMAYEQVAKRPNLEKGHNYWKRAIGADVDSMKWVNKGHLPSTAKGRPIPRRTMALLVDKMRTEMLSPEEARRKYEGTGDVMEYAAAMYGAYEWLKDDNTKYGKIKDFTDMLLEAHKVLKEDPQALKAVQRQFKIVLVDECQDQSSLQNEIFDMIGDKADTYMAIGDDFQSIYGFRSAKPEEFMDRKNKGFREMQMTRNYRSGENIVQAGMNLIKHNEDRQLQKTCKALAKNGEGHIEAIKTSDHAQAAKLAVQEIRAGLKNGDSADDYGIVTRTNAEKDAFMIALISQGIPYRSNGGTSFFDKPAVKSVLDWLKVATLDGRKADNAVLWAHSTPGFWLDKRFRTNLERAARGQSFLDYVTSGGSVYGNWRDKNVRAYGNAISNLRRVAGSGAETADIINEIIEMDGLFEDDNGNPKRFVDQLADDVDIEELMSEDGIDGAEISDEIIENAALAPIQPLRSMALKFPDPERFIALVDKLASAQKKSEKDAKTPNNVDGEGSEPAVQVDTCHQWKGLEAKNVYCVMTGGVWPNFRSDEKYGAGDETAYDEERRLAYVGITRGKENVTILSPKENYLGQPAGPSRFIQEACIPVTKTEAEEGQEKTSSMDFWPNEDHLAFEEDDEPETWADLIYDAFTKGEF